MREFSEAKFMVMFLYLCTYPSSPVLHKKCVLLDEAAQLLQLSFHLHWYKSEKVPTRAVGNTRSN